MNTIETATIIQSELDKAAVEQATSGWMEVNEKLVKYTGGAEVKIPSLDMDGMADYDRTNGFVQGSVNFQYETKKMTQDRGRSFSFDENDVDETNFVLTASTVMGEFQRTKVVPEIDAYRYSTIAAACIKKGKASGGYTADEATILQKLYYDIAAVQAIVGQNTPLVITIDSMVAAILSMSEKLSKKLDITDFKQGDVTLKVRSLDGIHPLIPVSSDRMKTEYLFKDGVTSGQEAGGFAPTENSKSINWIITPRKAPIAVSKTDKMRIFDPETNQKARAWAMDYRKFHDIWIPARKVEQCFVNVKEELAQGGKEKTMSEIELKRANVVKRVDSEDKAKALEAKGFVRTDGTVANKTESNAAYEAVINELKEQLLKAGKVIEASDARRGELEKELTSTKEKLEEASKYAEEADKKIATLEAELSGTKEQLEAALKKNKAAEKK